MAAKGTGAGRKPGNGSGTTYAGGVVPSRGAALEFERSINKSGYIDDTPVPVVVIDCDHVIEFINASAALMAGCSPQSCVGLKMWDVFEMEGCRNGTCLASRAMRDGHTQSGDAECIIKGQKNTVRASASPRYDAHNKVIGAIEVLQHNSEDQKFADELSRLVNASHEGQLQVRGNTELLQGRNRDLMAGINSIMDAVTDKLNWYQSILDAVQFPIHVIDKDMNWVFLNKAFEKLMVDNRIIRNRDEAPGMPCSSAAANICKTENCGLVQLSKGVGETYFDWHGQNCKQESSKLVNAKGEHIGYVEVVQDLTSIVRNKNYTENEVMRVAANLTKLAEGSFDLDLEVKEADKFTGEAKLQFGKINESLVAVKSAVQTMSRDADILTEAATAGNFETRSDATKHQGEYRHLVEGINGTLDVVVDKLNWYQSILDAVPFPIHVLDKDMNWVFLNKAFEKLMVANRIIGSRKDAPGMPCSSADANICKTENCGVKQLNRGIGESHFDWHGQNCKQDTSRLVNIKGEHVGYVEVVQDLTSIVRDKDYTAHEVDRLAGNLTKLAQGDFSFDLELKEADLHTADTKKQFEKINQSLIAAKDAVDTMAADAHSLVESAFAGELSTRANASRHQGVFQNIVKGFNETLDAILLPIGEGNRILAQISDGKIDELIAQTYKGDHEKMKQAVNNVAVVLQSLQKELVRLTEASREGLLSERGKPEQFKGAYAEVVGGVNQMLDAILLPIGEGNRILAQISDGKIDELIAQTYKGDHEKMKQAVNNVAVVLQSLQKELVRLTEASREGLLSERGKPEQFKGAYAEVVGGVNQMLDAILLPIGEGNRILAQISGGKIDELIAQTYKGDHEKMKQAVNNVAVVLQSLTQDTNMLVKAALDGKLSTRADASRHHGDFRKIVEGVNAMLDAVVGPMQDVSSILNKLAGGDFTATVTSKYSGDYDLLVGAVNTVSQSVRSALEQIGHNVASLSASAEELNKVSQSMGSSADETATQASVVSAAAEQVSNNVQTVATGADEMSASIKEIAKNTAEATRVAASAVRTAETTNVTISKLGQSSTEIGQVIKVITSIAQQTNLLALNATIEAARAGEAGKGFAVVANEVKELAKETAKATEDISRKIEAIQGDTNGAVSAISQISQVIGQISDIQTTIASAIEEQSATTNEIGRTLAEAAKGSTDISKNIGGVAEAAHATTVGATETSKSAQSLEKMSNDLRTLISQFRF